MDYGDGCLPVSHEVLKASVAESANLSERNFHGVAVILFRSKMSVIRANFDANRVENLLAFFVLKQNQGMVLAYRDFKCLHF